eukprot:369120_1
MVSMWRGLVPLPYSYVHNESYWWFFTLQSHFITFMLLLLVIWHSTNIASDFCTKDRRSVKFRGKKPKINKHYIALSMCAYLSIFWYLMSLVVVETQQWKIFSDYCHLILVTSSDFYFIAKEFMYLTFILRLHTVYHETQFAYKKIHLISIAVVSVILCILNCLTGIFYIQVERIYYDNLSFATHCPSYYPMAQVLFTGICDAIMSAFLLILFIIPLRSMVLIQKGPNIQTVYNLLYLAIKSMILTSVAILSTVIFLTSLLIFNSLMLGFSDMFLNSICIVLMTPYYDDDKYYKKLCCLSLKVSNYYIHKYSKPEETIDSFTY